MLFGNNFSNITSVHNRKRQFEVNSNLKLRKVSDKKRLGQRSNRKNNFANEARAGWSNCQMNYNFYSQSPLLRTQKSKKALGGGLEQLHLLSSVKKDPSNDMQIQSFLTDITM
jgi:hypothetical protein